MIRILYFASLRERLGRDAEELELPVGGVTDVAGLMAILRSRGGVWGEALAAGETVLVARNQEMAGMDTAIVDGDEVGVFPPVTGG